MARAIVIAERMRLSLALVFAAGALGIAPAVTVGFTVNVTPTATWCGQGPNQFVSGSNDPYFAFDCGGEFEVSGDPTGDAAGGDYAAARVDAPPGITITSASTTGNVYYSNASGWAGNSYFYGGGTAWGNGQTSMSDPAFSSNYWGFEVECVPGAICSGGGRIPLRSIKPTASESSGPSLKAEGSDNLWFQNRPGERIWNPPGDPWPLTLATSDPSGVCSVDADIGGTEL